MEQYSRLLNDVGVNDGLLGSLGNRTIMGFQGDDSENLVYWYEESTLVLIKKEIFEQMLIKYWGLKKTYENLKDLVRLKNNDTVNIPYNVFGSLIILRTADFNQINKMYNDMSAKVTLIKGILRK